MGKDIYPLTIVSDRYNGTYSDAKYLAFNLDAGMMPWQIGSGDPDEMDFWELSELYKDYDIGKGNTPQEAFDDLWNKLN